MLRFKRPKPPKTFKPPRPPPFVDAVWQDHKGAFIAAQRGKCGYCEQPAQNHPGAVEHHRETLRRAREGIATDAFRHVDRLVAALKRNDIERATRSSSCCRSVTRAERTQAWCARSRAPS